MRSLESYRVHPSWLGTLFAKEFRNLLAGRAFWLLLLLVCPLVGYSYIQAVSLYAEASRSAEHLPQVARNLSPLDGILVPTFGALYLANTFLFPFVAIRSIAHEKETGSLKLLLQVQPSVGEVLGTKIAALAGAWVLVAAPALSAVVLWLLAGGHIHLPELANLLLGHWLYGAVALGFALVAAALAESGATAAIITLSATLGFWVLDFAAAGDSGISKSIASLSPTALLRGFERGVFSLGTTLAAMTAALGLAVIAGILIDLKRTAVSKLTLIVTVLISAALLLAGSAQLHVFADTSQDRRNSFSPADVETLSGLKQLTVVVRLAPEDPRYIDFERNILSKLQRTVPDLNVVLESQSRTGALEEASEKYGTILYEYGGKRSESRSTGAGEILPLIYGLAQVTLKVTPPDAPYPGYPLQAGTRTAEVWFYGVLPLLILGAWISSQGRVSFARWRRRTQRRHSECQRRPDMNSLVVLGAFLTGAIVVTPGLALAQERQKSVRAAPASARMQPGAEMKFDFQDETVGAQPKSFVPIVGNFAIGAEGDNKVLVIDGRSWKQGQTAAGLAEHAKALYGERYGEFLDNVKAFAYFPYAVATGIDDFREGEISLRFKPLSGRIDQGAGILFNLKPNGDYLTVRANALENNLVLWKFERGRRSSVKWVRDVPTATKTWHDVKVVIKGTNVEGYLNGKLYLTHQLTEPVSGKIGVWSKADSHMFIDDYRVVGGP